MRHAQLAADAAAAAARQVFRPGNPTPSENGSSDAALPVGGEPESADDGLYDDLDEPAPAADGLPNDLGGMFEDDPDDERGISSPILVVKRQLWNREVPPVRTRHSQLRVPATCPPRHMIRGTVLLSSRRPDKGRGTGTTVPT